MVTAEDLWNAAREQNRLRRRVQEWINRPGDGTEQRLAFMAPDWSQLVDTHTKILNLIREAGE